MKRAIIFYQSKTGTTKHYAQEIGTYLQTKKIETLWFPVEEYHENLIENIDFLILGCWTKGLMVLLQKPDEIWNNFARKLPVSTNRKVALFATYKIRTGSMFKNMQKQMGQLSNFILPKLKSRNGKLSDEDKLVLNDFITE